MTDMKPSMSCLAELCLATQLYHSTAHRRPESTGKNNDIETEPETPWFKEKAAKITSRKTMFEAVLPSIRKYKCNVSRHLNPQWTKYSVSGCLCCYVKSHATCKNLRLESFHRRQHKTICSHLDLKLGPERRKRGLSVQILYTSILIFPLFCFIDRHVCPEDCFSLSFFFFFFKNSRFWLQICEEARHSTSLLLLFREYGFLELQSHWARISYKDKYWRVSETGTAEPWKGIKLVSLMQPKPTSLT